MSIRARQLLFLVLLGAGVLQTWLVYSDPAGRAEALSDQGRVGRELWHENGCQTCHQLYGFGGFLGPDLTNAAQHLTRGRLAEVLTEGVGQMPAFHFSEGERLAIGAFLEEMDATGTGQLPPLLKISAPEVLEHAIDSAVADSRPLSEAETRGRAIVAEQKCIACHLPNPASLKRAPDLTGVIANRGPEGVRGFVTNGIPTKGMPKFDLATGDLEALLAFLARLGEHAARVRGVFAEAMPREEPRGLDLPWFEYR